MTENRWIVAGLGNPGKEYENTWHNSGYQVLDQLSDRYQFKIDQIRFSSLTFDWHIHSIACLLLKPLTYMNKSGEAVREAAHFYRVPTERILVIYDDIDLPFGQIRVRISGGPGTHKGMHSIVDCLKSQNFPRIRIGIGPCPNGWELADYVLSQIPENLAEEWDKVINKAADAVVTTLSEGIEAAMRLCNNRGGIDKG
ncbi:MAG: aminoacyl-tRNA hydrolase [Clostridia bacterium]|nr:aminoacyl-tRNA hydrolase [Clostridia bacterium]